MSGHNKWSSIKNKKGKEDSKRAKIFTKMARAIIVATREGGEDPEYNPALKNAIEKAKSENMPNDNINRAIKKGAGKDDGDDYVPTMYEGYGPEGVAIIVECLTDNKNRTASNVRHAFDKFGGNLGQSGSVSFIFEQKGLFMVHGENLDEDIFFMDVVDIGAEDVKNIEDGFLVYCDKDDFAQVREGLEKKNYKIEKGDIVYVPKTEQEISDEKNADLMEDLLDTLEDDDDVQEVYTNWAD